MVVHELQYTVIAETVSLATMGVIALATFKRWKIVLFASNLTATISFFVAWSLSMTIGALLVYGSASLLMWWQLGQKEHGRPRRKIRLLQALSWTILAAGVLILILNNVHNIYLYLNQIHKL